MPRHVLLTLVLVAFTGVGCGQHAAAPAPGLPPEPPVIVKIADPTGDWGFPTPHAHYSRGPGYPRMTFLFDTLIWKDQPGFVDLLAESWDTPKQASCTGSGCAPRPPGMTAGR